MTPAPVHVTVTGAAGQIGYQLVFRIASGQLLGPTTPVVLRLLEIEPAMRTLEGVVMELDDGAFPLLAGIEATSRLETAFDGASWALLVGSVPRKAGMERGDLLSVNGGIFKPQGEAIAAHAASDVRVLVVGNPCNTNCLIARSAAKDVPEDRFFAMMRLDQNRAVSQLAARAEAPVTEVANLAVWGNHSATQFPDFENATVGGVPATKAIDELWLKDAFLTVVQQRGAAIIEARGASSAASAASAAIDTVVSLTTATPAGTCASVAVTTTGAYGVPEGLTFGLPIVADGSGGWSVKEGFEHSAFAQDRIAVTTSELVEERDAVRALGLV